MIFISSRYKNIENILETPNLLGEISLKTIIGLSVFFLGWAKSVFFNDSNINYQQII